MATAEKPKGGLEDWSRARCICYLDASAACSPMALRHHTWRARQLRGGRYRCGTGGCRRAPSSATCSRSCAERAMRSDPPLMRSLRGGRNGAIRTLTSRWRTTTASGRHLAARSTAGGPPHLADRHIVATGADAAAAASSRGPVMSTPRTSSTAHRRAAERDGDPRLRLALILHADHDSTPRSSPRASRGDATDIYSRSSPPSRAEGAAARRRNAEVISCCWSWTDRDRRACRRRDPRQAARKEKIPGFGHRVYTTEDPRATHLRQMSHDSAARRQHRWYDMSQSIEAW